MIFIRYGGDRFRHVLGIWEQHAEVSGGLFKNLKKINAKYNPVEEAESILASDALNVPALAGASSLAGALAY